MNPVQRDNLVLLQRRYLERHALLCPVVQALGRWPPLAYRLIPALTRLTLAAPLPPRLRRQDRPLLDFAAELELAAMTGLVELDPPLAHRLRRRLERLPSLSRREALPLLLARRLRGNGLSLDSERAGVLIASLFDLTDDPHCERDIWAFLAAPEKARDGVADHEALSRRIARAEARRSRPADRPVLGLLALFELAEDLSELLENAEEPMVQSTLWHRYAALHLRAQQAANEIEQLCDLLRRHPDIDKEALGEQARSLASLQEEGRWRSPLLDELSALEAAPAFERAPRQRERRRPRLGAAAALAGAAALMTALWLREVAMLGGWRDLATATANMMARGGLVMWVLLVLTGLSLAVVVERWLTLQRAQIDVDLFLADIRRALLVEKSIRKAVEVCERYPGPVAEILKSGLLRHGQPRRDVEDTMEQEATRQLGRMERSLEVLRAASWMAPVVGVVGTTFAVVRSFPGLVQPQSLTALSETIADALTTTAIGLAIGIVAQWAYNDIVSRLHRFVADATLSADALARTLGETPEIEL